MARRAEQSERRDELDPSCGTQASSVAVVVVVVGDDQSEGSDFLILMSGDPTASSPPFKE